MPSILPATSIMDNLAFKQSQSGFVSKHQTHSGPPKYIIYPTGNSVCKELPGNWVKMTCTVETVGCIIIGCVNLMDSPLILASPSFSVAPDPPHQCHCFKAVTESGEKSWLPAKNPLTPHPVDKSARGAAQSLSSPTLAPTDEHRDALQRDTSTSALMNISASTCHAGHFKRPTVISLFLLLSL